MPTRIIQYPSGSNEIDLSDTYYFRDSAVVNSGSLTMGSMDVFDEQEVAEENATVFAEDGSTGLEITLSFTDVRANSKLLLSGASIASEAAKVYGLNSVPAPVEIATFSGLPDGGELPELQEVAIPEECIIDGAVTLIIMRMAAEPGAAHAVFVCCIKHSFQGRDGKDGTTPSIADVAATAQTPPTLQYGEIAEGELTDALSSLDDGVLVLQAEDFDDSAELAISFSNVVAGSKLKISAWGEGIGIFHYRFTEDYPTTQYSLSISDGDSDESSYKYYDIPPQAIDNNSVIVYISGNFLEGGTLHIGHVSIVQTYKGTDGKDGNIPSIEDVGAERDYETPSLIRGLIASGELNDIRTPKEDGILVLEVDSEDPISMGIVERFIAEKGSKLKISAWGEGIGVFCLVFYGADANPDYIYYLPINDGTYDESSYKYYNIPDGCFSEEYPEDPIVINVSADPVFGGTLSGTLHIAHLSVVKTYHGTDARDAYLDSLSHDFTYPRSMFPYYFGSFRNLNDNAPMSVWVGFQSEYDSIQVKNPYVLYIIKEDEESP